MTTDTTSVEEQLAKMVHVIAKLTKTVEKNDLQIVSFMNKVETQSQNMGKSTQWLNHPLEVAYLPNNAPHAFEVVQVEKQTMELPW